MNSSGPMASWTFASFDWISDGVDPKFTAEGGPECVGYLSLTQRMIESVVVLTLCSLEAWWTWQYTEVPKYNPENVDRTDRFGKRFLLVVLCLTFGIEIGFKFATKTVIYLLNPCHVVTVIQIYLLAAPPNKLTTGIFRMQMASLSCPLLALVLPVVESLQLPFEQEIYWIQHLLIYLVIPVYLTSLGGVYKLEGMWDFSWPMFTIAVFFIYHFIVLQGLGLVMQVNLNQLICPAPSDPFRGQWYRVCAFFHQHLLMPLHIKIYTYVLKAVV